MFSTSNGLAPPYAKTRDNFEVKYIGSCFCGNVEFEIAEDPVGSSYAASQKTQVIATAEAVKDFTVLLINGSGISTIAISFLIDQQAAIIHKDAVFFRNGTDGLTFYNSAELANDHKLPCKVLCSTCHSPLADEGRRMMLVFPVAVHFESGQIPDSFKATHHMFYGSRVQDITDGLPKYLGKKGGRPIGEK